MRFWPGGVTPPRWWLPCKIGIVFRNSSGTSLISLKLCTNLCRFFQSGQLGVPARQHGPLRDKVERHRNRGGRPSITCACVTRSERANRLPFVSVCPLSSCRRWTIPVGMPISIHTYTHTEHVTGDVFTPKPAHTADRTEGNKRNKSALTKQSQTAFCQILQSMYSYVYPMP